MLNPGLPETLWSLLDGRLWHATERDGLVGIIADREIKYGVGNRYLSSFCRRQDCVSLFDFGPTSEVVCGRTNQMEGWLSHQQNHRIAIWLEIDRAHVGANLWDAKTARQKWDKPPYGEFIHGVEACHKGPIPLTAVVSALLIACDDGELFQQLDDLPTGVFKQVEAFEAKITMSPDDSIYKKSEARRKLMNRGSDGI